MGRDVKLSVGSTDCMYSHDASSGAREGRLRRGKEIPQPPLSRSTHYPLIRSFKKKKAFPPPEELDQHYVITQCGIVKGHEKAVKKIQQSKTLLPSRDTFLFTV